MNAKPPRPNIIVILADDLGYFDVGFNGNRHIRTPNLDRLAKSGVVFSDAYAGSPVCSPSRAAVLTGKFPNRVGMFDIAKNHKDPALRQGIVTVASVLRDAGYDTYHAGKWHVTQKWNARVADSFGFHWSKADPNDLSSKRTTDAIEWLETRESERPFFMYLAAAEPHHPVERYSPAEFREPYETRRSRSAARKIPYKGCSRPRANPEKSSAYFGAVSQFDHAIGRLLDYLEERNLRDDTFIVFTSDNGPERTVESAFGSAGPFSGCKAMLYEGGIRMPTAVSWPRGINSRQVSAEPIHAVDLLPTFAELSGAKLPSDYISDGVSILPAAAGRKLRRTVPLFWMYWAGKPRWGEQALRGGMQAAVRVGNWKLLARLEPLRPEWSVMDYLLHGEFDRYELYDLAADPGETRDLAASQPDIANRLMAQLDGTHRSTMAEAPRWDLEHRRFMAQWLAPDVAE